MKYTPENLIDIARLDDGRIVFLEKGRVRQVGQKDTGLAHILDRHTSDFQAMGVQEKDIPTAIMETLKRNEVVGYQGEGTGRPIYLYEKDGVKYTIAITVGDNGYIVGANPRGRIQ